MEYIRKATPDDINRIAEIEIFNYRLNFYPIFRNDEYYFDELQVSTKVEEYQHAPSLIGGIYVYDDSVVKGFAAIKGNELCKLFVEPVLQGNNIGTSLLEYAIKEHNVSFLWALEKNTRAISFYTRHGFFITDEWKYEDGTTEFLVKMKLK